MDAQDWTATHALLPRATKSTGSHRSSGGTSLSALVSTLIPTFLIAVVIITVFIFFQRKYERVYGPRTYLGSMRNWQRSPKRSPGAFGWAKEYQLLKDEYILGHASIDNYLWLRFFKMLIVICFVGCIITWPVLFAVNATGGGGETGLDILSFSNINPGLRYYASCFIAWIFLGFVMFLITRESRYYIRLRQQYYLSPFEKSRISARTVLFVNVPEVARNEEHLRREFAGVRKVWLVNLPEALAKNAEERDKDAAKLEGGEMKLITNHVKRQMKLEKKGNAGPSGENGAVAVDKKDRPTHRLPVLKFLPIGKKVDTIDWSRGELHRLIPQVAREQHEHRNDTSTAQGACFIEFETVQAAHNAELQCSSTKNKMKMSPVEIGTTPENVIWKNIVKPYAKVHLFLILCTAFVWWLCIFWTIPVAIVGAISNINYLTNKVSFLSFINDIPQVILGVVTGLLPVVLLAVLMALVPIICGVMAKLFEPTQAAVQLRVQSWYFPFQVIQVFLVTTFASGAASVVTQIVQDPSSATSLLAKNLPKASNFYISYFILFGLTTSAMQLLNVMPLLFALFLGKILDKTPRKMYNRYTTLPGLGWGSIYPKFTNLGVIALAYSCIAPLILGFATIGFSLLYLAFRYSCLFTLGTQVSTRGRAYARALQQLTVGIYLAEICLLGLYAIGIKSSKQAIGPLVLMIILLVATIVWHVFTRRGLVKLEETFPEEQVAEHAQHNGHGAADVEKAPGPYSGSNGSDSHEKDMDGLLYAPGSQAIPAETRPSQTGIMGRVKNFFHPSQAAFSHIWTIAPHLSTPVRPYTPREYDGAYRHPAVTSECPVVWIARDKYGVSRQEVSDSRRAVGEGFEISDEGAWYNEKGKIEWHQDDLKDAPVWEDKPVY